MQKEFIYNAILLLVINLLVKTTYLLGVEVEVQNTLGPESYGLYLALFNFSYLFMFINDPGIHSFSVTEISSNRAGVYYHFPRILGVKLLFGFAFILFVIIGAYIFGYERQILPYLSSIILIHILSNFYTYLRSNLSAMGRYRQDSFISAMDKLVMIIIIGGMLLWVDTFSLHHFLWGQCLAFLISIIIVFFLLKDITPMVLPRFSFSYTKSVLRSSIPFAIILLLMSSYTKLDGVMLERLLPDGKYQAGIYAASLRYLEASRMLAYLIAALLLPMFASTTSSKKIKELCDVGIRMIMIIGITVCTIGIVYRQDFMSIYEVYDPQYHSLLIWHLLSFFCIAISFVYGTLLTAKRKFLWFNTVLFMGVIINIGLNYWLISRHQALGAAIATFITQAFVVIGQVILAFRIFSLKINYYLVLRCILFAALLILMIFIVDKALPFIWIIKVLVLGIISVFLSLLLGVFRKDMIFAWYK